MREIKFRAWDGERLRTDFALISGIVWFETNPTTDSGVVTVETKQGIENYYSEWATYKPKPDWVVMQFTGLTDKNGVEIYEGDIVSLCGNENGYLLIEFRNAYVGGWIGTHKTDSISIGARKTSEIEIIGNIHENPELIDKGDNHE